MKHVRSFDPFRVLAPVERIQHLEEYAAFLLERDGSLDLGARTLSRREARFEDLARKPVHWGGSVEMDGFYQHLHGTGRPALDPRTTWLVAVAKANQAESYGVEFELRRRLACSPAESELLELRVMLQEQYHGRILTEACRVFGLDTGTPRPHWTTRWMIYSTQYLPDAVSRIPMLGGEALGCVVFQLLRESCGLFSEEPDVEERLRALMEEIWIDEILHVAYLRARLGAGAVRAARRLLPLVVAMVMRDVPQLRELGATHRELVARASGPLEIPAAIDWLAPDTAPTR